MFKFLILKSFPFEMKKNYENLSSFREKKNKFAVCSKGHIFKNGEKKIKFVEWIETLRAIGADTFIYYYQMPPKEGSLETRQ